MKRTTQQLAQGIETLDDFKRSKQLDTKTITSHDKQFSFFTSEQCKRTGTLYRRRDFFKIGFLKGSYLVHYGDETIKVEGASLSIFDPDIPYTVETINEEFNAGFFIFTDLFYNDYFKQPINQFPLFANGHRTIFGLDSVQEGKVRELFDKIGQGSEEKYELRYDLIRNYLNELLHFASKLDPVLETAHLFSNQERLVNVFKELLDRQFPVSSKIQSNMIRKAGDFADILSVHVNYLNKVVKQITGKSTTKYIWERYFKEAILLLKHTSYSISEIAYSLGFSDASHFNHFFRSMTTAKPSDYRKSLAR